MNEYVSVQTNAENPDYVDYFTGRCSQCGAFHRYYPEPNGVDDQWNRQFPEGFFDCHECSE